MRNFYQPNIILVVLLMSIIVMIVLPMPAWILDVGLASSFGLAILIFTTALFIERPLDFSIFPTILLASLVLRLALNISSTKLIIGEGHTGVNAAGNVIEGFAMFVMGGSIILGLVVFCVILIVNFLVITKGASRMAEVGARFALDGMPGKQLAIDSDMSAGAIDHFEARLRRETEQQETTFFGSLDGASKFVKGDAIAGLLITILNLIAGTAIGVLLHDMDLGNAFETYSILTVGDGLVNQIPAVIISISSALLLARGGAQGSTETVFLNQLGRNPSSLLTVGILMGLFAFVPGLPVMPFMLGSSVLIFSAYVSMLKLRKISESVEASGTNAGIQNLDSLGDLLDLDDVHVEFSSDLVAMVLDPATGLDARIANMRNHIVTEYGLVLPEIRLTDNAALKSNSYVIKIQGVVQAQDSIRLDRMLAVFTGNTENKLEGEFVNEPVYGAPAIWIAVDDEEQAALSGATVVTPTEVLATHLLEVIKTNFGRLCNLKTLRRILDEFTNLSDTGRSQANRRILDELVPDKVPVDLLLAVLRLLLEERVSIRNLPIILEAISEVRGALATPEAICEHVRQRLGFQIVGQLRREDGTVPLLQLSAEWEEKFNSYQVEGERGQQDIALPPEDFNKLASNISDQVANAGASGIFPAMVTSTKRRRFLRTILRANGISNPVISFEEIGAEAKPALVGVVPV